MARHRIAGLHRRGEVWAVRIMIPTALREPFYEGRTKVRLSLSTTDPHEARVRALAAHAEWAAKFAAQKAQLTPTVQAVVTPELAQILADRLRARILALDDSVRFDPEMRRSFFAVFAPYRLRVFTAPGPEFDSVPEPVAPDAADGAMSPEQLQQLARVHDALRLGLQTTMSHGQLRTGEAFAAYEARSLGLSADWSKQRPAVVTILRAVISAFIDVGRRNLGDPIQTPQIPEAREIIPAQPAQPESVQPRRQRAKGRTLWDVRDEWATGKSKDAQAKMERALKALEAAGITAALDELTRQHALDFRSHIRETMAHRAAKTQSDVMANVQTLLNFAVTEKGYLRQNPWAGTAIAKGKQENRRQPWMDEDLRALFASPIWQSYQLPEDPRAGGAIAYWGPLIALHGGLRIAEICQLRVKDVETRNGVLVLDVNEDEGKAVKSAAGVRVVPVHSNLVRLGFADYVADTRDRVGAEGLLFPDLFSQPSRPAQLYQSDCFRRLCQELEIYQRWRDFHGLRTTVSTTLRGVHPALDESLIDAVMGHEGKGSVGRTNYTVHAPQALARVVEHLSYPAASALPRVYSSATRA